MLHLFHPALVHFSVAFLVVGGLCEAWGLVSRREPLARWGSSLVLLGTISLVPALATGYLAANTVEVGARGRELVGDHERNGWIVIGVFVAALFWKGWFQGQVPDAQRLFYSALLLLGVAFTIYSAMLGGQMVYFEAVGVQ